MNINEKKRIVTRLSDKNHQIFNFSSFKILLPNARSMLTFPALLPLGIRLCEQVLQKSFQIFYFEFGLIRKTIAIASLNN